MSNKMYKICAYFEDGSSTDVLTVDFLESVFCFMQRLNDNDHLSKIVVELKKDV